MIGGNTEGILQIKLKTQKNAIGEIIPEYGTIAVLKGFLDLSNGDSKYTSYNAKIQESTHIFICNYACLLHVKSENSRMIVNGKKYDILLIDNPMGMNKHMEIYLKYVGD